MINTASTRRQWNFWAGFYENLWVQRVSLKPTRLQLLKSLEQLMVPGSTCHILDVGCGTGQLIQDILHAFPQVSFHITGIDYAEGMVRQAKKNLKGLAHVSLCQMDAHDIPQLDQSFDLIVCTHSFPYYENQQQVLHQFHKALKPGGNLLLAQAASETWYDKITLFFVSLTTGKAHYPTTATLKIMTEGLFYLESATPIQERWFMPSILSFRFKRRDLP